MAHSAFLPARFYRRLLNRSYSFFGQVRRDQRPWRRGFGRLDRLGHSHRAWLRSPKENNGLGEIQYPIASDPGGKLARQYNILIDEANIALRGLFIIDPEGVLQYSVVNTPSIGRSVDETLRVLQALQTGGFCPADWQPGQKTL